ncbi:AraC family transcriptional regulator [Pseudooceanicola aestuarii]|uniref:AraC family transcriptional regulator n=1 Tax=Pseudooceanicola aestuarii TaxID=2697319 RepID=UPI0013D0BB59|nr:AraC family transcriptional regulator [Pseudooceanicola aestuarii]
MPPALSPVLSTVSLPLIEDWLDALRCHCASDQLARLLAETGLDGATPRSRVTHDQIVRLYQRVAVETGDEMMGLWSRPIRSGALKHICVSVRGASSLGAALYRLATFWTLLLDDYRLELEATPDTLRLRLVPRGPQVPHRFGQMLLMKLAHGIASWLAGRELPVRDVALAFARPEFAADYAVLFPAPVRFGASVSAIGFDRALAPLPVRRTEAEMREFLIRAPRDWIFTGYHEHTLPLRLREMMQMAGDAPLRLDDAARALKITPRTLIRRLAREGTSFQGIRDGLRRDMAIRDLAKEGKSLEAIAQDLGFASAANFHRAFKRWTGVTPGAYRRGQR